MDSNLALLLGALDSGTCKTFFKLMKARDFRSQKNQFVPECYGDKNIKENKTKHCPV